jgi:Type I phosphodiesterase / nucleotide pyrophosphatase
MPESLAKKLLLIGWDAADWKVINPLLDQGLMPTLDDFINHGVMGNLATLRPILSPMLWNSIATGKRANKDGIHGFMEPDTQNGGIRPVSSTSRKVKAIWNILTSAGSKRTSRAGLQGIRQSRLTASRFPIFIRTLPPRRISLGRFRGARSILKVCAKLSPNCVCIRLT